MNSICSPGRRFALTPLALSAALFLVACGGGGDSSSPAAATAVPPTISAQPAEQAVTAGKVATFSVTASGDALSYQWQVSTDGAATWTNIAGATSAAYTVTATDPALNGTKYRVVISSAGLTTTSSPVTLTVAAAITAPVITVDVAALAVTAGADAAFSVTASGSTLSYQWQTSTDGTTFANVAGATGATLMLPAVALTDSGKSVRVAVTNSAGTVNSSAAALYVTPAVVDATLLSQPTSMSATAPSQVTFSVTAAGSPAPTFQWQKSTDAGVTWVDIAGATAATYTTPATAVADSGSLFRVKATNATAAVTSDPAALTIAAAPVPVAITTQPIDLTVTAAATATFTVVAAGTPTPTYQWQVSSDAGSTFINVTGATQATFTTPATSINDNGKRYRVVVSNATTSTASAAAKLTVNTAVAQSGLNGRAWTAGQPLESGAVTVTTFRSGLDESGNAVVVFAQNNGSRLVLNATHGAPGTAGTAPSWTSPISIDASTDGTYVLSTGVLNEKPYLTVAPNGNAVAVWPTTVPCTSTMYNTSGSCQVLVATQYDTSAKRWNAPKIVADTPTLQPNQGKSVVVLNNRGDVAILYTARSNDVGISSGYAVAWRAAGQSTFRTQRLDIASPQLGMDDAGNMTVAGTINQNSTVDFIAYRGSSASGFGAQELIDGRSSEATGGIGLSVGRQGQILTFYTQNNGTATRLFAVTAASAIAPFTKQDLIPSNSFAPVKVTALDNGDGLLYYSCKAYRWTSSSNTWSAALALPGNCPGNGVDTAANGDTLFLDASSGLWSTYDASTNRMVHGLPANATGQPASAFLYGVNKSVRSSLNGRAEWSLSSSGIGLFVSSDAYDVLPTPSQPDGDGRPAILNLWGLYFK